MYCHVHTCPITSCSQLPGLSLQRLCARDQEATWYLYSDVSFPQEACWVALEKRFPVSKLTKINSPFLTFLVCSILTGSCLPMPVESLEVEEDSRNITLVAYHREKSQGNPFPTSQFTFPRLPIVLFHEGNRSKSLCFGREPEGSGTPLPSPMIHVSL